MNFAERKYFWWAQNVMVRFIYRWRLKQPILLRKSPQPARRHLYWVAEQWTVRLTSLLEFWTKFFRMIFKNVLKNLKGKQNYQILKTAKSYVRENIFWEFSGAHVSTFRFLKGEYILIWLLLQRAYLLFKIWKTVKITMLLKSKCDHRLHRKA